MHESFFVNNGARHSLLPEGMREKEREAAICCPRYILLYNVLSKINLEKNVVCVQHCQLENENMNSHGCNSCYGFGFVLL